jgi:hypothetical protein
VLPTSLHSSKSDNRPDFRTHPTGWVFLLAVVLSLLNGCAGQGLKFIPPADPAFPRQTVLSDVPFFAQKAYQCGPAALAMALQWSGVPVEPDDLVSMVYVPDRKGSLQSGMIGAARRHGRLAYPIEGLSCAIEEVAAGHPVIVLQNLGLSWIPRWHYAVIVGYDLIDRQVVLHTGALARRRVGFSTFQRTWQRAGSWGLLVLPPGRMPVCAEEQTYLKAALGLQQAGEAAAALEAFREAWRKWPQSYHANMGLGNAQYAVNDLNAAADAFRRAASLDPQRGDALNNLAHVLAELGMLDEAADTIHRALLTEGPNRDLYMQTLKEIEGRLAERR